MKTLMYMISSAFIMATIVVAPLAVIDSNSDLMMIAFGLGCIAVAFYIIGENFSLKAKIRQYNEMRASWRRNW
jgi:positive regulator of sigma E activity